MPSMSSHDGASANAVTAAETFDLVVLDLNLPEVDGLDVLRAMRARQNQAGGADPDRPRHPGRAGQGLDLGADDYLIKPFDIAEFEARVRVLLRRQAGLHSATVTLRRVSLDLRSRAFFAGSTPLDIPARELGLLEILFMRAGKVVAKEAIIQSLTAFDDDISRQCHRAICQPPAKAPVAVRADGEDRARHRLLSRQAARGLMTAAYSLRRRLLFWLLISTAIIGMVALADTYREARADLNIVSDRVLAGSALAIAERVVVAEDGSLRGRYSLCRAGDADLGSAGPRLLPRRRPARKIHHRLSGTPGPQRNRAATAQLLPTTPSAASRSVSRRSGARPRRASAPSPSP